MQEKQRPKIGIGVYILNNINQVLMLFEKRADGTTWSPPGGHLEFGEEFLTCVKREVMEETGLEVLEADLWSVNNNITPPNFHYVNLDFVVSSYKGTPKIRETHKCEKMDWFDLNNLPTPLLAPTRNFFKNNPKCLCRSGKQFSDCHGKK